MNEELDGLFETLENDLLSRYQYNLLLNYITNLQEENKDLKEKVDQYENPDDYTLFYMWLDTRAKDKMKQMEHEVMSLKQHNAMITKLSENIKDENQKLVKVIDELEKHICSEWYCFDNESVEFEVAKDILNKLTELKGGNNDEV